MSPRCVDVGNEFSSRLANRDKRQGDGKNTAIEFRERFLSELDTPDAWKPESTVRVVLDFANVTKLGPSFANAAFGYFVRYASPAEVLKRIEIKNLSNVKLFIIKQELDEALATK